MTGGFAWARIWGYKTDGVDKDPNLRFHQNAVFACECVGTLAALVLLASLPLDATQKEKQKKKQ